MDLILNELQTFGAVADALLPSLPGPGFFWTSSGSALVRNRLPTLFSGLPNDRARNDLRRLLRMLDTGIGGLLLYGRPRRFADLALDERESVLRRMATSRSSLSRQAFQVLKRLAGILAVTTAEGESFNPVWSDIGYPGPFGPPPRVAKPLNPVRITTPSVWQCDVVVVGSGAGGGAAAGVLAAAGLDVVVLEKGRYLNASDFTHLESEAYRDLYLDNQLASTADLGIGFFAGSCLGGGTVLGYTTSFATPQHVREEWDRIAGFSGVFTGSEYETALSAVFARLRINTDHSKPSPQEALMEAGLRARGWHAAPTARNAVGCSQDEECGFCTMGCRRQARQSAQLTWLQDAAEAGTRIIVEAEVMKVVTERGRRWEWKPSFAASHSLFELARSSWHVARSTPPRCSNEAVLEDLLQAGSSASIPRRRCGDASRIGKFGRGAARSRRCIPMNFPTSTGKAMAARMRRARFTRSSWCRRLGGEAVGSTKSIYFSTVTGHISEYGSAIGTRAESTCPGKAFRWRTTASPGAIKPTCGSVSCGLRKCWPAPEQRKS